MANASAFFTTPSVPSLRGKIQPSISIYRSGFCCPERISKRVFCSGTIEEHASGVSASESRVSRWVLFLISSSLGNWTPSSSVFCCENCSQNESGLSIDVWVGEECYQVKLLWGGKWLDFNLRSVFGSLMIYGLWKWCLFCWEKFYIIVMGRASIWIFGLLLY